MVGATATETFAFDVEPTPRKLDGIVEVTYTSSGDVEMVFTSLEGAYSSTAVVEEDPGVDTPPYDIETPAPPDDPSSDEWNDDYLGENQPTSPSVAFERIDVPSGVMFQYAFREFSGSAYWVEAIMDATARELLLNLDHADEQTRARLTGVGFPERVLVAVQTGYGSGSVSLRWSRVEATDDGLHLYGYYTDPYIQTDDLTSWVTILDVERPEDDVVAARVSLTTDTEHRVHCNSTEGVLTSTHPCRSWIPRAVGQHATTAPGGNIPRVGTPVRGFRFGLRRLEGAGLVGYSLTTGHTAGG